MIRVSETDVLRYSQPGPRYTSYPTVPLWNEYIGPADWRAELRKGSSSKSGLSLYVHIPFCEKLCHFCACNRVIDRNHSMVESYFKYLFGEIDLVSENLSRYSSVVQMHWGGGTPTFLRPDEISRLSGYLSEKFNFDPSAELSIEVNPVVTNFEHLARLRALGFQRLSMGVQDFDPIVQNVINRHQSFEQTRDLVRKARDLGFGSINLDLIYGLPKQNLESFSTTLRQVIELKPERLAIYSFAKVPWKQPFQRRFSDRDLPTGFDKVSLYLRAREMLLDVGYEPIGMDHFTLPSDCIAEAAKEKKLHRNFMGYTTQPDADLIGFGISAISSFGSLYVQNEKTLPSYYRKIKDGLLATRLGCRLSEDDQRRRYVIMNLMCNFEISFLEFRKKFGVDFKIEFEREIEVLQDFVEDELVQFEKDKMKAIGRGQILIRNIVMAFDRYLEDKAENRKFSNTI